MLYISFQHQSAVAIENQGGPQQDLPLFIHTLSVLVGLIIPLLFEGLFPYLGHMLVPLWGLQVPLWVLKVPLWGLQVPLWVLKVPLWGLQVPLWVLKVPLWGPQVPLWILKVPLVL